MELLKVLMAVPLLSEAVILCTALVIGAAFKVAGGTVSGLATLKETLELPVPRALGGILIETLDVAMVPPEDGTILPICGTLTLQLEIEVKVIFTVPLPVWVVPLEELWQGASA